MLAKVCGLTHAGDASRASRAGADLLGFVVHPPSPRHCLDLCAAVQGQEDKSVLVTVSQDAETIMTIAHLAGIHRIQPHSPQFLREALVRSLRERGFWVLLPWPDEPDQPLVEADLYLWEPSPGQTGVAGGSGQTHSMAYPPPGPFLLAGGLDASNVRARLDLVPEPARPLLRGADAASRLESTPGRKDPLKVQAFIEAIRR